MVLHITIITHAFKEFFWGKKKTYMFDHLHPWKRYFIATL